MKTGQTQEIANSEKALFLSLLSVCVEETCKTALLYTVHHNRTEVTADDMIRSLKYQLISENGCGPQLKLHLKEAMETGTISDLEQKPMAQEAVIRHYNNASDSIANNSTKKAQASAMIDHIIGNIDSAKEDEKDEKVGDKTDNEDEGGVEKDDKVGDKTDDKVGDNEEGADEKEIVTHQSEHAESDYEDDECDCDMCTEIDTIFGMDIEPSDDFERMIMVNFQTILNKYK
jgi:hypothetical protein